MSHSDRTYEIVIVGGGEAGLTIARAMAESVASPRTALIEPSAYHYDQPTWVRTGTEGVDVDTTRSRKRLHVPEGVDWIQDTVTAIDPNARTLTIEDGAPVHYTYLVLATGIRPRWGRVRGLKEHVGTQGICSVYGYEQAPRAWDMIQAFDGGNALFTAPSGPHKGGSTPLNVLRRAEARWREAGVRADTDLFFATASDAALAEEEYAEMVERNVQEDDVHLHVGHDLIEVRPEPGEAVFRVKKGKSESRRVLRYDLLHVVPPMRPPPVVEQSELAYQDGPMRGYLKVDPESFRHERFETVFGVGDVIGVEGVKTSEEARAQAAEVARVLERVAT